jgi:hypothetical protein
VQDHHERCGIPGAGSLGQGAPAAVQGKDQR